MKRERVSQWDRDNFNHECKLIFKSFAEFVAIHYALAQRDDTPYWKNNLNKTWDKKLIDLTPSTVQGLLWSTQQRENWSFFDNGGLHCIAAGMNWYPTDIDEVVYRNIIDRKIFIEDCKNVAKKLDDRKKYWDKAISKKPSYYNYLKNEIYKV